MQFGPLSQNDIRTLEALLEQEGAVYKVTINPDRMREAQDSRARFTTGTPYVGDNNLFYIDIETKDLLIVKGTLERLGFVVSAEPLTPEAEVPEYLCPRCDYLSGSPGLCPKHHTRLLEFSKWNETRKAIAEKKYRPILWIFLALLASLYLYDAFSDSNVVRSIFINFSSHSR